MTTSRAMRLLSNYPTSVFDYITQLSIQRMFVDTEYHDEFVNNIYERYSYYDYFFSFKPMESKYWFTEEEVNKYKLELVDESLVK